MHFEQLSAPGRIVKLYSPLDDHGRAGCGDWLAAKHRLKPSTLHGHRVKLAAATAVIGEIEVQKLTKRNIDDLVTALRAGGGTTALGATMKPWSPRSVNYLLGLLTAVLRDQLQQGHVVRNVAELVDRILADAKRSNTFTPAELQVVLAYVDGDRYGIAWQLALSGLRRSEISGLRWSDVKLDARTLKIEHNCASGGLAEAPPKSAAGRRKLPLPDHIVITLKQARAIQAPTGRSSARHMRPAATSSSTRPAKH